MKAYKFLPQPRSSSRDRRNTKPYQKCWFIDFLQENHNFSTTVGTLLNDHPWCATTLSMVDTHLGPACIAIQNST